MTVNANSDESAPRIAVIGSGYRGKNLVRNFHRMGALDLICDRSEDVLATFSARYPGVNTCLALSEVLKNETIDGVAIATPAETHYGLAKEALLGGKHVYVEKPIAMNETEGEALIELARDRERVLMVGHFLQYHPILIKLKALAIDMPVPARAEPENVDIPQEEPLRQECEHFLHCIATGQQPITDGREGLRVLRVLNASQRSLDLNGRAVKIAPRPEPQAGITESSAQSDAFVHESAVIDSGATVGKGTRIWHFSHVLKGSEIGENCNIGQNVVIGPDVSIGNGCKIQNNVSVYKGVTLEDGVFCGPSMVFTNIYNPRAEIRKMDQVRPTWVKKGATLGANSTIVCGTTIGRYAFVGAGAVVNKNVVDHALVVGNPAKPIGWVCECGERLPDDLECLACERRYQHKDGGLEKV